jgi:capsular polysaccharide biosynthesis protein
MEGRHVGAVLWRQWPIALLVTVLTGAAVAVGVMMAPKTYTATAEISALSSVQGSNDDQDSLRSTLGELANSREVVADVEEELDGARSGDELRRSIAGRWVEGTVLVEISVDDRDPEMAARIANLTYAALTRNDPSRGGLRYTLSNPANPPVTYSSPNLLFAILVGTMVSLVLGAAAALARDRRTFRITTAADLESVVTAPVLGHVHPPGDLNAWLAANLAISTAQVGRRTLLVDARMGAGAARQTGTEPGTPGLYEVLRGTPLVRALSPGPVHGLDVLPSGSWGAESHAQLLETSFASMAEEAQEHFDVVVVIANPTTVNDDAVTMGARGAVVLAVPEGALSPEQLRRTSYRIGAVGARLLGTVLVGRGKDWGKARSRGRAQDAEPDWAGLEPGGAS